MANGNSKGGSRGKSGVRSNTPKQYFSQKPGKADIKALKAKLEAEPGFILDFLAGSKATERLGSWYDDENQAHCVSYNLGYSADHSAELVVVGRGSTLAKALALCIYWLVCGVTMELLFPVPDNDPEAW